MQQQLKNPFPMSIPFGVKEKKIILQHSGREHILYFSKGLNYILTLLEYPELIFPMPIWKQTILPLKKYTASFSSPKIRDQQLNVQNGFLSVPMTDLQTIKEVKQELINVINELAELKKTAITLAPMSLETVMKLRVAICWRSIIRIAKSDISPVKKVKLKRRVVRAINRALAEIDMLEPELAKELSKSIEFRRTICYHQRRKN